MIICCCVWTTREDQPPPHMLLCCKLQLVDCTALLPSSLSVVKNTNDRYEISSFLHYFMFYLWFGRIALLFPLNCCTVYILCVQEFFFLGHSRRIFSLRFLENPSDKTFCIFPKKVCKCPKIMS